MLPSIFGENLFDDFFGDDFGMFPMWNGRNPLYGKHAKNLMKTDVRETDTGYEVDIDLPGFKKDEISVELKDGYLTVSAAKGLEGNRLAIADIAQQCGFTSAQYLHTVFRREFGCTPRQYQQGR